MLDGSPQIRNPVSVRQNPTTSEQRAALLGWFAGQVPDDWFSAFPDVSFDNDEILVVGRLPEPHLEGGSAEGRRVEGRQPEDGRQAAEAACIDRFREDTREQRVRIAEEAQHRFGRKVSWGARCGGTTRLFTTASVPVMTRLRLSERTVLDTLIDAGVARSRSEALAWCVRLVGRNESEWISDLRSAFEHVEAVRAQGPKKSGGSVAEG
jgi:hypothetical protein